MHRVKIGTAERSHEQNGWCCLSVLANGTETPYSDANFLKAWSQHTIQSRILHDDRLEYDWLSVWSDAISLQSGAKRGPGPE